MYIETESLIIAKRLADARPDLGWTNNKLSKSDILGGYMLQHVRHGLLIERSSWRQCVDGNDILEDRHPLTRAYRLITAFE
jgi:hypothetical protein